MLKRIIKRDGQTEEFIPSKLNKWAIWSVGNLDSVDWPTVVLRTIKGCPEEISSQDLQKKLINTCVYENDWDHNLMAGRLYAAMMRKQIYGEQIPTVKELHEKLHKLGLMSRLNFTDEQYCEIEKIINHDRDFTYAYFQVSYMLGKYSIQNRVTGIKYETPQFIALRCAMGLSEEETGDKVENVRKHYEYISRGIINLPTPGFNNLGTDHHGYASCCLYSVKDTLDSLAAGDHIAYIMTAMSAGIGNNIMTRSLGDTVRNGAIEHNGKLPYYKALAGSVMANKQGSRGGACTTYYSAYDPEASVITMLQNPRSPKERQNRDLHFAIIVNTHFAKAVIKNTDLFSFTVKSAPDLHEAMYSGDDELFESLYNKYENDETFEKIYFSPRKLIISASQQALETGTLYFFNASEVNKHTPFKDPIYSSNLCSEIAEPTLPYSSVKDLYSTTEERVGEVALCNLSAINVARNLTDEEYEDAMYYALKMIDVTIHKTEYRLPHVGVTAKARMNAGVGIIGLAYYLANKGLDYTSPLGLKEIHKVAERHMYFAIKASLRLGKELGNAPWINRTKWPDGWLPIDTYNKRVDELVEPVYQYDWESLRKEIIANGGIRNSTLIAHMPTESSSKAAGVPNGVYPIRGLYLKKTDGSNVSDWVANESNVLASQYQFAYDIDPVELNKAYAVLQKFCDQAISADSYYDRSVNPEVKTDKLLAHFLSMIKYGVKTRYYTNSLTTARDSGQVRSIGCEGGACTL